MLDVIVTEKFVRQELIKLGPDASHDWWWVLNDCTSKNRLRVKTLIINDFSNLTSSVCWCRHIDRVRNLALSLAEQENLEVFCISGQIA